MSKTIDDWLLLIFTISYRNLWIFAGSIYPAALFNYLAVKLVGRNQILGWIVGFGFCVFAEITIGKASRNLFRSRSSKKKRPGQMIETVSQGWAAFLTSTILMIIAGGLFHLNVQVQSGPFGALILVSIFGIVGTLTVAAIVELGKKIQIF